MADIFTESKRSEVMSRIRSKNTSPELRVRKLLFSRGYRYRLHRNDLPGNPDLVFPAFRTVVFINGCFWHGHPCNIGSGNRKPKTHSEYWNPKIEKNILRDRTNHAKLCDMGWNVIVVWECETKSESLVLKRLTPLLEMKKNG